MNLCHDVALITTRILKKKFMVSKIWKKSIVLYLYWFLRQGVKYFLVPSYCNYQIIINKKFDKILFYEIS